MDVIGKIDSLWEAKKNSVYYVTLISFSVFYAIVTMSMSFTGGYGADALSLGILIFALAYFFISNYLIRYYSRTLNYLIRLFGGKSLAIDKENVSLIWLVPSLICGVLSIILFGISAYYIQLEINTLGNLESYFAIVANLVSTFIIPLIIAYLLLGFLSHIIVLCNIKKIQLQTVFMSSILTILIFSFLFWFIKRVLIGILIFIG